MGATFFGIRVLKCEQLGPEIPAGAEPLRGTPGLNWGRCSPKAHLGISSHLKICTQSWAWHRQ